MVKISDQFVNHIVVSFIKHIWCIVISFTTPFSLTNHKQIQRRLLAPLRLPAQANLPLLRHFLLIEDVVSLQVAILLVK